MKHVIIDIFHRQVLLNELTSCPSNVLCLLFVAVAPINRILDRFALVIMFYRPVVVHRHQTSGEEVVVMGSYK
uniref:Uncharacterized protein n=1 Tax=Rhizophora mucronata TaxID=61149 RepID=A0A2P2NPG3_RHIMU